jgi:hypothetical protein
MPLGMAVRTWPTPTAQDAKNDAGPSQWERNSDPLNVAVKREEWRTPTAHDWKNHEKSTQVYLSDQVEQPSPATNGGQLNPTWVEWLMGFPLGFTELTCDELGCKKGCTARLSRDEALPEVRLDAPGAEASPGHHEGDGGPVPLPAVPHGSGLGGRAPGAEADDDVRDLPDALSPEGLSPSQDLRGGMPERVGEDERPEAVGWWDEEPDVGRVARGVPHRVQRLRALGNAVVPQVVQIIGERIIEWDRLNG